MEILQLIIKQKFFDEILAGKKKQEFREIRPNTQKKYCELDAKGHSCLYEAARIARTCARIQQIQGSEPKQLSLF